MNLTWIVARWHLECGVKLARARYAVFGIDYEGHGHSDGARCYIKKFDNIIDDCHEFFRSITGRHSFSLYFSL